MEALIRADIFYFISSIGFSILFILGCIALVYAIKTLHTVHRISRKIADSIDSINEEAKSFLDDIRDGLVYRIFFGKTNGRKKK